MRILTSDSSKIRDNLWLGGQPMDLDDFKYVFAFNKQCPYYVPNETMVVTRPFEDSDDVMPSEELLHEMAQMVLAYSKKGKTLVHCLAGINRSALVTALALMYDGMTAQDAIALLREKRDPVVLYNKQFENWLLSVQLQK